MLRLSDSHGERRKLSCDGSQAYRRVERKGRPLHGYALSALSLELGRQPGQGWSVSGTRDRLADSASTAVCRNGFGILTRGDERKAPHRFYYAGRKDCRHAHVMVGVIGMNS